MNPYGITGIPHLDHAAIRAWNRNNARARREYALHPTSACTHGGHRPRGRA